MMRRFPTRSALLALLALLPPREASAGMPMFGLSEVAALRLHVISFFLLLFFLLAWGVQKLWNYLRRDFPALPALSYRRAVALVALWGLAFNLVLVMISGARELMTPGAWVKDGALYHVRDGATPGPTATPTPEDEEKE